jgi:hypothetical protein
MGLAQVNTKFLARLKNTAVETFNLFRERYGEEEEGRFTLNHCHQTTSGNVLKAGRLVQSGG